MSLEEELSRLDKKVAKSAICVRLTPDQDKTVRKLAADNEASVANIIRLLVERGLREA